ncbi:hypothetical protein MRX96_034268 [Rhipicephalus microplus]
MPVGRAVRTRGDVHVFPRADDRPPDGNVRGRHDAPKRLRVYLDYVPHCTRPFPKRDSNPARLHAELQVEVYLTQETDKILSYFGVDFRKPCVRIAFFGDAYAVRVTVFSSMACFMFSNDCLVCEKTMTLYLVCSRERV